MNPSHDHCCSRRDALRGTACGFGYLALAALANESAAKESKRNAQPAVVPQLPARAKRVIFLFMSGGVSHVDSFDLKPLLIRDHGKSRPFSDARVLAKTGKVIEHRVMKPLWRFRKHGDSGLDISELFPHTAAHADDLCVIRSMHTEGVAHGPATLFLHTGATNLVRPSMGAWVSYGLGTENRNLPGFVSIAPAMGNGGPRNYGNAFLPSRYQGPPIGRAGIPTVKARIRDLVNEELSATEQKARLDLIRSVNAEQLRARPADTELEAVASSYELAYRMQAAAPPVLNVDSETPETLALYGVGQKETDDFGRQCLMARRLVEAGVRYVQVNYADNTANPAWDQHSNMPKHADHARAVDRPIAGLLADLKRRGLLDDTLVWWGGEFGRTPYAQNNGTGRDHNPNGFSIWLAGGGVKPGIAYGQTDDYGHEAVENRVHMHDLHATVLHLLGLDHERLTYQYAGRNFRLTDLAGRVVHDVIA
jgi:hypothetical protein